MTINLSSAGASPQLVTTQTGVTSGKLTFGITVKGTSRCSISRGNEKAILFTPLNPVFQPRPWSLGSTAQGRTLPRASRVHGSSIGLDIFYSISSIPPDSMLYLFPTTTWRNSYTATNSEAIPIVFSSPAKYS